jgi:hypothetical protein
MEDPLGAFNNACAFRAPDSPNTAGCEQRLTHPSWNKVNARVCHIRGRAPGSARYDAGMSDVERGHFDNLILMCPNHHTLVDDLEPHRFSVEFLTDIEWKAFEAAVAYHE